MMLLPTSIKEKETHWPEESPPPGRSSEEGDKPPPAPDQDLASEMFGLLKQPWLIQPGPVETLVDSTIDQESTRK